MNYKSLGAIFRGISESGCYADFDEFNSSSSKHYKINLDIYKKSLDVIHSDYYCSIDLLMSALKEKSDENLNLSHKLLIKSKLFDIPLDLCTKENIELLYQAIDNICNSYHKFLTVNALEYYNKNNITFISRYDTLCPLQNPIYLNVQGNRYVYNASKIQFNDNNFIFFPSHCPIFDGYNTPDIDLFLKMIIDNDIRTICIPLTFEPSKTFKWFPTNKSIIKRYNTKIMSEHYVDKTQIRECDYELKLIYKTSYVDNKDSDKDETSITESIKLYTVEINDKLNHKKHLINIYRYNNWPDKNIPENYNLIYRFVHMLFTVLQNSSNKKILVHCSAGIGRTGTVITCLEMLKYINDNIKNLQTFEKIKDFKIEQIYRLILEKIIYLRQYRPLTVQNLIQFNLIVKIIEYFIYEYNKESKLYEQSTVANTKYKELPLCGNDCKYWLINVKNLF